MEKIYVYTDEISNEVKGVSFVENDAYYEGCKCSEVNAPTRHASAQYIFNVLDDAINGGKLSTDKSFGAKLIKKLCNNHRYLQSEFILHFILPFLHLNHLNFKKGLFDGRNEHGLKICSTMWEDAINQGVVYCSDYTEKEFVELMDNA